MLIVTLRLQILSPCIQRPGRSGLRYRPSGSGQPHPPLVQLFLRRTLSFQGVCHDHATIYIRRHTPLVELTLLDEDVVLYLKKQEIDILQYMNLLS